MEKSVNTFIESRPQEFCLMCGRCCRMSTAAVPYEEMKIMAEQGDKGAIDFLEIFEPYESIEAARSVDEKVVDNIVKILNNDNIYDEAYNEQNLTFYRCRYILENNLCGIYENRKELCDRFPSSAWAVTPPGCGFEGWMAQRREELKQRVRKQKQNLLRTEELLSQAKTDEQRERIKITMENIRQTINLYAKYGANDW